MPVSCRDARLVTPAAGRDPAGPISVRNSTDLDAELNRSRRRRRAGSGSRPTRTNPAAPQTRLPLSSDIPVMSAPSTHSSAMTPIPSLEASSGTCPGLGHLGHPSHLEGDGHASRPIPPAPVLPTGAGPHHRPAHRRRGRGPGPHQGLRLRRGAGGRPGRREPDREPRPVRRRHGPVGLGQVHPPALPGRPGHPRIRARPHRRPRSGRHERQAADRRAPRPARLRLPGLQPPAHPHRGGEHPPAHPPGPPYPRPELAERRHRSPGHRRPSHPPPR